MSYINDFIWSIKSINPDTAIYLGNKSIELSKKLNFYNGVGYAAKNIGGTYYYAGKNDKALNFYNISLEYFEKAGNKQGIAIGYRNIGNFYDQKGDWKNALDYYLKSKTIREDIGDKKGLALVNNSIGLLYSKSKQDVDSAINYYNNALEINKELDNKLGMAESYLYIANYYLEKEKDTTIYEKTLENIFECRKICVEINEKRNLATCEEIIGNIYINQKKYDEAFKYLNNSLKINQELVNNASIASSFSSLAYYYLKINDFEKSEFYYKQALSLANETNSSLIKKESYKNLSLIYSSSNKYKEAYLFLVKFNDLKDSLESEESVKEMTQLSMQYEFDKKQKFQEIEQKQKEEIQNAQLKRQKMVTSFFIIGFILMILLAVVIFRSYRNKQKANKLLEDKNNEIITKSIILQQQKEEIEAQRDEIELHRDTVLGQNDKIQKQNKHITDSIVYAKRIQKAVIPPQDYLSTILEEYFVFFKPRDIVSGDFYWATQKDNKIIITAADCTGHGVPGAFMSMLGVSFLNEIVNKIDTTNGEKIVASEILDNLKASIMKSLRQTGKDNEAKDGMDMALCVLDYENMQLQFCGAHNPLYLVRNNELTQYKADRMPVGISYRQDNPFTNTEIQIQKNDICYLFSDGYVDQFGGKDGRKYSSRNFKEFILTICNFEMKKQKELMEQEFENWKAFKDHKGETYEQIDDVLVVGFRI